MKVILSAFLVLLAGCAGAVAERLPFEVALVGATYYESGPKGSKSGPQEPNIEGTLIIKNSGGRTVFVPLDSFYVRHADGRIANQMLALSIEIRPGETDRRLVGFMPADAESQPFTLAFATGENDVDLLEIQIEEYVSPI